MADCYVCGQPLVEVIYREGAGKAQICGACAGQDREPDQVTVRPIQGANADISCGQDNPPPRVKPEGHHQFGAD